MEAARVPAAKSIRRRFFFTRSTMSVVSHCVLGGWGQLQARLVMNGNLSCMCVPFIRAAAVFFGERRFASPNVM